MVDHLDRSAVRPADFLTINKQAKQLGEMPHGCELVVKLDLERAALAGALLMISETATFCSGVSSADALKISLPLSSQSETSARSVSMMATILLRRFVGLPRRIR